MEMQKQQKQQTLKSQNRVNFENEQQENTFVRSSNQEHVLSEPVGKQIEPETKSHIFISSSEENWDTQVVKEKLLKLIQFIKFHKVDHTQIWANKKQLSVTEFAHIFHQNYGIYLSNDELTALLKICRKKQCLKSTDFQRFGLWIEEVNPFKMSRYSTNLSSQTIHLKKPRPGKTPSQNKLNKSYNTNAQNVSIPQVEIRKHSETFKSSFNLNKSYGYEGFKEAQRYSKAKVHIKVEELKKDIKESVLEKKWDFIVMAGEMNQWIDQIKKEGEKQGHETHADNFLSYKFKVLNRDPVEIIQQNVDLKTSQSIPHVVFIKKYQTLKKKMVRQENNKNNLKGTVLMVLEDQDKFSKNVLINRINQRDQELNFVLLQIMRMKSMFQWQDNILKEAKINS